MIADAAHVRAVGNFPESLQGGQINPHLRTARTELRQWVGETTYDAAEQDDGSPGEPQTESLKDAEAYLAIHYGLVAWNTVMKFAGTNGAAGLSDGGKMGEDTWKTLSASAVKEMRASYFEAAHAAAQNWLLVDDGGLPGPARSFAMDSDGRAMDDNWPEG